MTTTEQNSMEVHRRKPILSGRRFIQSLIGLIWFIGSCQIGLGYFSLKEVALSVLFTCGLSITEGDGKYYKLRFSPKELSLIIFNGLLLGFITVMMLQICLGSAGIGQSLLSC